MALTFIKDGVLPTHPYVLLIDNIRSFMMREWNVALTHTLQEENSCADWLAKLDASFSHELRIIPTCSSFLLSYCLVDARGIQFLHL